MSKPLLSYETLVHALAGATGGVVGMTVFYPLDAIRSRIQVEDSTKFYGSSWKILCQLANEEGLQSLYRGLSPVLQSLYVSNFVYFYTFHFIRKSITVSPSAIQDLLIGVAAGSINVLLTSPLWVVNTRMKMENNSYPSLIQGLFDLYAKDGWKGLWSGTLPSLLLVSNPAIQFMIYEALKRKFVAIRSFNNTSAFFVGALAKAIATTITYPLQLIQTRIRAGASIKPLYNGAKKNPFLLFRGLEAKLLQTILTAALMFAVYEKLIRLIFSIMRVKMKSH